MVSFFLISFVFNLGHGGIGLMCFMLVLFLRVTCTTKSGWYDQIIYNVLSISPNCFWFPRTLTA